MVRAMAEPARIMVVDDDGASRGLMAQILAEDGHAVLACSDGAEAMERLERDGEFDVVVSDIRMVDVDGLEVLDWVHKHAPETPVLLVTAFGNVDGAVDAIQRGAYDYISKPYDVNAIHASGPRAAAPFLAVDCGSIAEGVLESELFGHARGSFTGATGTRHGLFEEASGGTLFLDEIGDIGPRIQGQLLRVLQEGEIRRVGESTPVKVDTRVVAATNKDLGEAVKAGRFREDLFYRLNVVSIRIPPLRERREDIPLLAEHFAARHAGERGASLTTEAREALLLWDWPGNVRELENAVARALALNPGGTILPEDLPEQVRERWKPHPGAPVKTSAVPTPPPMPAVDPLTADHPTLDELSRRYAERVLRDAGGNKTRAAEALGIDRKTLSRLLREE